MAARGWRDMEVFSQLFKLRVEDQEQLGRVMGTESDNSQDHPRRRTSKDLWILTGEREEGRENPRAALLEPTSLTRVPQGRMVGLFQASQAQVTLIDPGQK